MNLTDQIGQVMLRIDALSPAGPKRVLATGGKAREFSGTQLQAWEIGPYDVTPGLNVLVLDDILKDRAQYPLFVSSIEVQAAQ